LFVSSPSEKKGTFLFFVTIRRGILPFKVIPLYQLSISRIKAETIFCLDKMLSQSDAKEEKFLLKTFFSEIQILPFSFAQNLILD
jgi:hypothetical protein